MKKTNMLIIISVLIVSLILINLYLNQNEKMDNYINIKLGNYELNLRKDYKYKYLDDKNYGVFENSNFINSYIYISPLPYQELISKTTVVENVNQTELKTSIEEANFGSYQAFINIKNIRYHDTLEETYKVTILIYVREEETLVIEYETKDNNILNNLKEDLDTIK